MPGNPVTKSKQENWRRYVIEQLEIATNKATTTQLEDNTDAINTNVAKVLGYAVLNTTTGVIVFAEGNGDSDIWDFYNGNTAHTPV